MTWIWQISHSFTNAKSFFSVKYYHSSVQLNRNGVSTHILGDVVTLRDSFGLAFCHRDHFTNGLCEWHLENQHYRHLNSNRENRKPKHLQVEKRSWQTICQVLIVLLVFHQSTWMSSQKGLGWSWHSSSSTFFSTYSTTHLSGLEHSLTRRLNKQTIRQADK